MTTPVQREQRDHAIGRATQHLAGVLEAQFVGGEWFVAR